LGVQGITSQCRSRDHFDQLGYFAGVPTFDYAYAGMAGLISGGMFVMNAPAQAQSIIEQAVGLSASDRLKIVDTLLSSLDEPSAEFDQLWVHEAERRLAAYQRGEMGAVDAEVVLETLGRL
jgi:hypothetical protein